MYDFNDGVKAESEERKPIERSVAVSHGNHVAATPERKGDVRMEKTPVKEETTPVDDKKSLKEEQADAKPQGKEKKQRIRKSKKRREEEAALLDPNNRHPDIVSCG